MNKDDNKNQIDLFNDEIKNQIPNYILYLKI